MTAVGYARVSTPDQTLDPQVDRLNAAGCTRVFSETVSGAHTDRPALAACLDFLRAGDSLVVVKLDRLGRSLQHLLVVAADLESRGVQLRSLSDALHTSTASGRLIFHVLGAVAEFERDLIRDRTCACLAAARQRSAVLGRRSARTPEKVARARQLLACGMTAQEVAGALGTSRGSLYRWLAADAA